ncbi:hypothetical protein [Nocardia sp. NPDC003183]
MSRAHGDAGGREIDLQVWQEVARIRNEWIIDLTLTPDDRAHAIDAEAAALTEQVDKVESTLVEEAISTWITAHGGAIPSITAVAMVTAVARGDAQRQVLCEQLYCHVSPATIARRRAVTERAVARRREQALVVPDPQRWRFRATMPSQLAAAVMRRTWGIVHSDDFMILALALIQVRLDDGMPIPVTPLEPLADELAAAVHAQLRLEGLPPV